MEIADSPNEGIMSSPLSSTDAMKLNGMRESDS